MKPVCITNVIDTLKLTSGLSWRRGISQSTSCLKIAGKKNSERSKVEREAGELSVSA